MGKKNKARPEDSLEICENRSVLEKIIGWGIAIMIGLLPILYFGGRVAAYVTTKEFFFIGTADILAIGWIWLMMRDARYRLGKWNLIALSPLFLLLISLTVSSIVGVDPRISFYSTVESGMGMILLWHAFLFACMIASFIRVQGNGFIKRFLQAELFGAVILGAATFFTNYTIDIHSAMLDKSFGGAMMGNALLTAAYLLMSIFLGATLFFQESSRGKKIGYGIAVLFLILGPMFFLDPSVWSGVIHISGLLKNPLDILGHARMAALALGVGLAFSFFLGLWLGAKRSAFRAVGIFGTAIVIISVLFVSWQVFVPASRIHSLFIQEAAERPVDWKIAIEGIRERPLLGWGPENYQIEYLKHLNPVVFDASNGGEIYAIHPHNASLEMMVNGGIVGFIFYLVFIGSFIGMVAVLYRRKILSPAAAALILGMMLAYLLQNQMVFDSVSSYILLFSVFGILAGLVESSGAEKSSGIFGAREYAIGILATIVFLASWVLFAWLPSRKVIQMKHVGDESANLRVNDYGRLFHSAGSAIFKTDPEFYTLTFASSYNAQRQYFYDHPDDRALAATEVAGLLDNIDSIWNDESNDYRFALSALQLESLEMFLLQSAPPERLVAAKKYFDRAVALSPNDAQVYLAYVETMVDSNDIPAAKSSIEKSLSLNSENYEVWNNALSFAKAYGTAKDVQEAQDQLEKFPQYNPF